MRSVPVLMALCLGLAGCGDNEVVESGDPIVCGGAAGPCVDARFVAHQDDDLLFMNPDVVTSLAQGNAVVTVFLTAGTNADVPYMTARETGILNAYAYMVDPQYAVTEREATAAMLAHWRLHDGQPITLGTHRAIQYDFAEAVPGGGSLALVFLRLVEINGVADLKTVFESQAPAIATVACATDCVHDSLLDTQSYSRDELIDTLELVMDRFETAGPGALAVSTLDATQLFHVKEVYGDGWVDNSDHVAAAEFVVSAFARHHRRASAAPRTLLQYRGYNTGRERANLGDTTLEKRRTFYRYYRVGEAQTGVDADGKPVEYTNSDPEDPHFTQRTYQEWTERKYVTSSVPAIEGQLAVNGACLMMNGSALALGPCTDAPRWQLTPEHELRVPNTSQCVALPADLDMAVVATCGPPEDAERTTFVLTSSGQIRGRDALCLEASPPNGVGAVRCHGQVNGTVPTGLPAVGQHWAVNP